MVLRPSSLGGLSGPYGVGSSWIDPKVAEAADDQVRADDLLSAGRSEHRVGPCRILAQRSEPGLNRM